MNDATGNSVVVNESENLTWVLTLLPGAAADGGVRRDRQGQPPGDAGDRGSQGLRHLRQPAGTQPHNIG